jgi:glycosyltransferase involved in cell wall biosynthesis
VRAGQPLVITIHDVIPFVLPAYRASRAMRVHLALMRRTVRAAEAVLAPSHAAADDIATVLGLPRERIRVTPEAADPACRPVDDLEAAKARVVTFGVRGRYVFNIGGVDVRKNVPMLIEAFARLTRDLAEPVQLVIAGAAHSANTAVFPPLKPVVERFGLQDRVVLTGRVSEADKLALYQAADLYVTPSAYEGFGLTALEAMACGVPTIAANRTSFPEVVGKGGLLVELDAEAIAAAMRRVLEQPELARDLRQRGLERAAEFSWAKTSRLTLDVYREVIDRKR